MAQMFADRVIGDINSPYIDFMYQGSAQGNDHPSRRPRSHIEQSYEQVYDDPQSHHPLVPPLKDTEINSSGIYCISSKNASTILMEVIEAYGKYNNTVNEASKSDIKKIVYSPCTWVKTTASLEQQETWLDKFRFWIRVVESKGKGF